MHDQHTISARTLLFGLVSILEIDDSPATSGEFVTALCDKFSDLDAEEKRHIFSTALCLVKQNPDKDQMWEMFFEWSPFSQAGDDLINWLAVDFDSTTRQ